MLTRIVCLLLGLVVGVMKGRAYEHMAHHPSTFQLAVYGLCWGGAVALAAFYGLRFLRRHLFR